jgi:RNA polymerase sigma-70 factor (ECF subfamily)
VQHLDIRRKFIRFHSVAEAIKTFCGMPAPERSSASPETSLSLLDGLRAAPSGDQAAWRRLWDLYAPLIRNWLRRHNILPQDQDDLVQEVLTVVLRKVGNFQRVDRAGAFRRWLLNITVNCLREFWRSKRLRGVAPGDSAMAEKINQLADEKSQLSRLWETEHDQYILQRLLEQVKPQFELKTWTVFCRITLDSVPVAQAAEEAGITMNAAFIAKSRVLAKLRELGRGLLDFDE